MNAGRKWYECYVCEYYESLTEPLKYLQHFTNIPSVYEFHKDLMSEFYDNVYENGET